MAAAADGKSETAVDFRARIVALDRKGCQRAGDVEQRDCLRGLLDRRACSRHGCREAIEDFEFKRQRPFRGTGDLGLEFAELAGGETHLAGGGLAVDESRVERRRHQLLAVLRRNVDEVAEHIVMPDLQGTNARRLRVAHLQRGDNAA